MVDLTAFAPEPETLLDVFAREELAPAHPPAAPSPPMARPKRTPGTTNAPGGEWFSTPPERRRNKPARFTLMPEAAEALAFLAPGEGERSREVSAAIVERAKRKGWCP